MPGSWEINVDWQQSLPDGEPEEAACLASIGMCAYGQQLMRGHDMLDSLRHAPVLSGYHLALWFALNWWRLRWEPRRDSTAWALAHSMASIGEGYIWPHIDFVSDGRSILLNAKPTEDRPGTAFRYITPKTTSVLAAADFEAEVDRFVTTVVERLEERSLDATGLAATWSAVIEERASVTMSARRKLEALLGLYPEDMDESRYAELVAESEIIGVEAVEELAAAASPENAAIPTVSDLREMGREAGHPCSGFVRLDQPAPAKTQPMAPWESGATAARLLRDQEHLGLESIPSHKLSHLCGLKPEVCCPESRTAADSRLSFFARGTPGAGESLVVLRPTRWEDGRRFELARLLGDELMRDKDQPLVPATRSHTYRQRAQRAFAAELLSPFQAVDGMLDGDYSEEAQQEVAAHFQVSPVTIRTQLANHRRIGRFEPDWGVGVSASPG